MPYFDQNIIFEIDSVILNNNYHHRSFSGKIGQPIFQGVLATPTTLSAGYRLAGHPHRTPATLSRHRRRQNARRHELLARSAHNLNAFIIIIIITSVWMEKRESVCVAIVRKAKSAPPDVLLTRVAFSSTLRLQETAVKAAISVLSPCLLRASERETE
jgi:hypothetical protein